MKLKRALGILVTVWLLLQHSLASPVAAQEPEGSALRIRSSSPGSIVLELSVSDYQIETLEQDGQTYQRLHIPGAVQTDAPGEPQLPTRGALLGLSTVEGVSVQVIEARYDVLRGQRLPPAPGLRVLGDDAGAPVVQTHVSHPAYRTDAFYPGSLVAIGHSGYLREQAVAQVQFYPVQYNPVSGELRLYRRILARVTWDLSASTSASRARADLQAGGSPAYENLLRQALLNYPTLERPSSSPLAGHFFPPSTGGTGEGLAYPLPAEIPASLQAGGIPTPALKIAVATDGLYELTYDDLANAGLDPRASVPRTLKLYQRGVEIPIYVQGEEDGVFDPGDVILFYGTALNDMYTVQNIYWLTMGGNDGLRMSARDGSLSGSAPVPEHFPLTQHIEKNDHYWGTMPNGQGRDHWFWGEKLTAPASQEHSLTLHNPSTTASTASVRVRLEGRTDTADNPDHHTRLYLNGVEIDDQLWDGLGLYEHYAVVSHTVLHDWYNILVVEGVGDTGAAVDQILVNWIEIDYWATYTARNNELLFGAPEAGVFQFEVSGFSTNDVAVFDISDPHNVARVTQTTMLAAGYGYKLQFEDSAQAETRYLALAPSRRLAPASVALEQPSAWKSPSNGADYILITHKSFYTSALQLADHRRAQGLRVATVKIEDVYDEFNYGIYNPQAIRDFLTYAYQHWAAPAPTYVLLMSGASHDYRNFLHMGRANFVPTQLIETSSAGETASDNWFVLVSGDDLLPDMFIGRLPAQNPAEAQDLVNKMIAYEQHPPDDTWNNKVLLVADDTDSPLFETITEQFAARLPFYYPVDRIYVINYPPGDPSTDIINSIDSGKVLVSYAGHGSVYGWGGWHGVPIFDRDSVAALNNVNKLPVVTLANCWSGYFVWNHASIAETFLQRDDRGAVAVWANSGLGYPSGLRILTQEFYDAVFQDDQYALGAATTAAKIAAYSQSSFWGEMVETFVLFGDPATPLGLPVNYPYLESVFPADGAADVAVNQDLLVAFSKPMHTATLNDARFSPTWNADRTLVRYTHPNLPYSHTLTLTLYGQDKWGNPLIPGLAPSTWSFSTAPARPMQVVTLNGPAGGVVNSAYTFEAAVSPLTTSLPITYVWQASGQAPLTHTLDALHDSITLAWNTPGPKSVSIRAANAGGAASSAHDVSIAYAPPGSVDVSGPGQGAVNTPYTFRAAVGPLTATQPLTYTWRASGQAPQTHAGASLHDSASFTWNALGPQMITVTAANAGGSITNTARITVLRIALEVGGPAQGLVNNAYTFWAAVRPLTASLPITYAWQASGQSPQTHTGGLSDMATFSWPAPGTLSYQAHGAPFDQAHGAQNITVTASNAEGVASSMHRFTIHSPPTRVNVTGPTTGVVNTLYNFYATTAPITTSLSITYVWQASGQAPLTHADGGLSDTVSFSWDSTGPRTITATASNAGGQVVNTHTVALRGIPPEGVSINGPTQGLVNSAYEFSASVNPISSAQPITYVWQASGQATLTRTGGLSDAVLFEWGASGVQTITVTATNVEGVVSATHYVNVSAPPSGVSITGPATGTVNTPYNFFAAAGPLTATQPLVYVWQASGQTLVHTNGLSDMVALNWDTPGAQVLTVTAANAGGLVVSAHVIDIFNPPRTNFSFYLPLVLKKTDVGYSDGLPK